MAQKGVKLVVNERLLNGRAKRAKEWAPEKREFLHDAIVPGAVARVHGRSGRISLGMLARFPLHPANPTFRKIADYSGAPSLNPWRQTVRDWHDLIGRGVDPS